MKYDKSRQGFYLGQSINDDNLNTLQDFAMTQTALLQHDLIGKGICNGLELEKVEGFLAGLYAGTAYNDAGVRLNLENGQQVDFGSFAPTVGEKVVYLFLDPDYIMEDPVLDSKGNTVHQKLTPTVKPYVGEEVNNGSLQIATITLSPVGIVEITQDEKHDPSLSFQQLKAITQPTGSIYTEISDPEFAELGGYDPMGDPSKLYPNTYWEMIEETPTKEIIFRTSVGTKRYGEIGYWYDVLKYADGRQEINGYVYAGDYVDGYGIVEFVDTPFADNFYTATGTYVASAYKANLHFLASDFATYKTPSKITTCIYRIMDGGSVGITGLRAYFSLKGTWTTESPTPTAPQGVKFQRSWRRISQEKFNELLGGK